MGILEEIDALPKGDGCTVCGFDKENQSGAWYVGAGEDNTVRCDELFAVICRYMLR